MSAAYTVRVTVDAVPRGDAVQTYLQFTATSAQATWSWGLQPSPGVIEWITNTSPLPVIQPMAQLTIEFRKDGVTKGIFYGIAKQATTSLAVGGGARIVQEFVDSREFLQWDTVYCLFNQREERLVAGVVLKRYWHIYPDDFKAGVKTFTTAPLTAKQVMAKLFTAAGVLTTWSYNNYTSQASTALNNIVPDLNWSSGVKLGTAVLEVSERCGTTFTLDGGRYRLAWVVKGVGSVPSFPATSDDRRLGLALSGHPDQVVVIGDRNQYQVLNITLAKDWIAGWEALWDVDLLADDLYKNEKTETGLTGVTANVAYNAISGDTYHLRGRFLARNRALRITVAQYAALREARSAGTGVNYLDYRKFQGVSRLQIPAAQYIRKILFRAFRVPAGFTFTNAAGQAVALSSLRLAEQSLTEVVPDPVAGTMTANPSDPLITQGNGFAHAQGYMFGPEVFNALRPETFSYADWKSATALYQPVPFTVDGTGDGEASLLFAEPILNSSDLVDLPSGYDYPVLKASPTFATPVVKAALTFEAERFQLERHATSNYSRTEHLPVAGLAGQFVCANAGSSPVELAFADGETASQKATAIADARLTNIFSYPLGGYALPDWEEISLGGAVDRVNYFYGAGGIGETVDFTMERLLPMGPRGPQVEPERNFNRRSQLEARLPGDAELKAEANQFRLLEAAVRLSPDRGKFIVDAFTEAFGQPSAPPLYPKAAFAATVAAGTPLWKDSTDNHQPVPAGTALTAGVYLGSALLHGAAATGPIWVATGAVQYILVKGPVAVGDPVGGEATVQTYLVKGGVNPVGRAEKAIADTSTKQIPVRVGEGSVLYVRVCKRDGTERFIPFRVVGAAVDEADIPSGSNIYDPTS